MLLCSLKYTRFHILLANDVTNLRSTAQAIGQWEFRNGAASLWTVELYNCGDPERQFWKAGVGPDPILAWDRQGTGPGVESWFPLIALIAREICELQAEPMTIREIFLLRHFLTRVTIP